MATEFSEKLPPFLATPQPENLYHFFGALAAIVVTGEQTNGAFSLVKLTQPPHAGPPLHLHELDDEEFYILRGTFTFYVGDDVIEAKEGDYLFAPRGIPHTYVTGPEESDMLVRCTPAMFDQFVRCTGIAVKDCPTPPPAEPPTPEQIAEIIKISEEFGISFPNSL